MAMHLSILGESTVPAAGIVITGIPWPLHTRPTVSVQSPPGAIPPRQGLPNQSTLLHIGGSIGC